MNLKILIADDEALICKMLMKLIKFEELGLELAGVAHDGEQVVKLMEEIQPDIVITDISMPKMDGLECIRQARQNGWRCKFIVISGFRQFEYAYNALKYDVEDYLLKPIDGEELNATLRKLVMDIQSSGHDVAAQEHNDAIRRLFVSKVMRELEDEPDIEEINRTYCTTFQKGLYRMLLVRVDFSGGIKMMFDNISSFQKKIVEVMSRRLMPLCYDIIFDYRFNGITALVNTSDEKDEEIKEEIKNLLQEIKNVTDMFSDLLITVCIGKPCSAIVEIRDSRTSAYDASWMRMAKGTDKVLFADEEEPTEEIFTIKLQQLEERMKKHCESQDKEEFVKAVHELFLLPKRLLCTSKARRVLQNMLHVFFEINGIFIDTIGDRESIYSQIHRTLDFCYNFRLYEDTYIEQFSQLFDQIANITKQQKVRPIRQAMQYVEEHYSETITLETVAREVNLSTVYFSSIFKKETGQNFTEYVTEYRIKLAKTMLRKADMNVNEIADALGFVDQRYFSRIFKKHVGLNPSAYKRIYN